MTRPRRTLSLITAMSLLMVAVAALPAHAYSLSCGKYNLGSNPELFYRYYTSDSGWKTAFGSAQSAWDATASPGWFTEDASDAYPEISVYTLSSSDDRWAWNVRTCISGYWDGNRVDHYYNLSTTGSLTATQKKLVAEHEIGHAYGLNHTPTTCSTSTKAVMQEGTTKFTCSGTAPWQDDVNGVNALY